MLTDADRRELYELLERGLGARGAELMMEYLPPVGWGDIATKRDLDALRVELRGELAEFRGEIRGEIRAMLPKLIATNIAAMIGVSGLVLAASQL